MANGHPIQVAARRSGLTADVIRVWERRYGAVEPIRTETNRRLYSDEDVQRLLLLARVTRAGRRIGDVARLPVSELQAMAHEDVEASLRVGAPAAQPSDVAAKRHFAAGLDAVHRLDADALRGALERASIELSQPVLFDQLLDPLMTEIGSLWHKGSLRVANEHVATAIVRTFLGALQQGTESAEGAPELIVTTPAGQRHELGALMVAVAASADGWRVSYCGCDLPAEEIAAVAFTRSARVLALSIVYPADDAHLAGELRKLRSLLEDDVVLIAGGASATAYEPVLREIDARIILDVATIRMELQALRNSSGA